MAMPKRCSQTNAREVAPNLFDISPPPVVTPVGTGETVTAVCRSEVSAALETKCAMAGSARSVDWSGGEAFPLSLPAPRGRFLQKNSGRNVCAMKSYTAPVLPCSSIEVAESADIFKMWPRPSSRRRLNE